MHGGYPTLPMRFYYDRLRKNIRFSKLIKGNTVARRSKRNTREVIEFEMNLGENLTTLSDALKNGTYKMQDYYNFAIYDPQVPYNPRLALP